MIQSNPIQSNRRTLPDSCRTRFPVAAFYGSEPSGVVIDRNFAECLIKQTTILQLSTDEEQGQQRGDDESVKSVIYKGSSLHKFIGYNDGSARLKMGCNAGG